MARSSHPAPRVTADMLRDNRLFRGLSDEMLAHLAAVLPAETAAPGEVLITEGEMAGDMFLVLAGEVEVLHHGGTDHDVTVALLGTGDWAGEMAILGDERRSATVRAVSPTLVLRMTTADVRTHLRDRDVGQYACLIENIARELSRRLRVADSLIAGATASMAGEYIRRTRPKPG